MSEEKKYTKILTPEFRLSFNNLFKPKVLFAGQAPKYSAQMLFKKGTDLSAIQAEIKRLIVAKWGTNPPQGLVIPLKDGDKFSKKYDSHIGHIALDAKANQEYPPQVVLQNKQPATMQDVYSGCYGRAFISFYTFDNQFKKGVGCNLMAFQKVKDGEPLGNRVNAADEFSALEGVSTSGFDDAGGTLADLNGLNF